MWKCVSNVGTHSGLLPNNTVPRSVVNGIPDNELLLPIEAPFGNVKLPFAPKIQKLVRVELVPVPITTSLYELFS